MFVSLTRFDSEGKKFFMQRIMVYEVPWFIGNVIGIKISHVKPCQMWNLPLELATCHVAVASLYHKFWAKY